MGQLDTGYRHFKRAAAGLAVTVLMVGMVAALFNGAPARAQDADETPVMMATGAWLTPPPTVYPPAQADDGEQVYYYFCMVCHGPRGQGLTQEWRDELGPPDNNCWQSRCHSPNSYQGFTFPKLVPAVVGRGILPAFETAQGLHDFLVEKMPWQDPGMLSEEQYWQLTAYLIRANGYELGDERLSEANAAKFSLKLQTTPTPTPQASELQGGGWVYAVLGGAVLLGGLTFAAALLLRRRR